MSCQNLAEIRRLMKAKKKKTNLPKQGSRWIPEPISRTEGNIQN
jgi:hypothetical protein